MLYRIYVKYNINFDKKKYAIIQIIYQVPKTHAEDFVVLLSELFFVLA